MLGTFLPPFKQALASLLEHGDSTWRQSAELSQGSQISQIRPRESDVRKTRRKEYSKDGMPKALNSAERAREGLEISLYLEVLRLLFI